MEEFIAQIAAGSVTVKRLITHRFSIEEALDAYELILKGKEPFLGVLIEYPAEPPAGEGSRAVVPTAVKTTAAAVLLQPTIGVIGTGLYATTTLLPILKSIRGVRWKGVADVVGMKGRHIAQKFGFEYVTTNHEELLRDPEINLVFILTRHGSHARLVGEALGAGKDVFVEKPLCIDGTQLQEIRSSYQLRQRTGHPPLVMVGFNRRFSPCAKWLKEKFAVVHEPLSIHCTVNAGPIPPEHWVYDPHDGGGRIIGEVCHFIDLAQYLTGSVPATLHADYLDSAGYQRGDNISSTIRMKDGSIVSILYIASGDKRYVRERIEIFGGGAVGSIENFKRAVFIHNGRRQSISRWLHVDRGHRGELETLVSALRTRQQPVPVEEYWYTTQATFAIEESLQKRIPVDVIGE